MLKRLYIKNLVLVESCEIHFKPGFNVLTGETGAGKSIILSSLSLLLGQRQDSSQIRQGAPCAIVEATFDLPSVEALLDEAGIVYDPQEEICIRRELSASGKSRTFVNDQAVGLSLLKQLAPALLEITSQHGHIELLQENAPLLLLDRFADTALLRGKFQKAYSELQAIKKAILQFHQEEAARARQMETCRRQIEEIEEAKCKEGEDEEIFSHYSQLATQAESAEIIAEIVSILEQDLSGLMRLKAPTDRLAQKNQELAPLCDSFKRAFKDLQEMSFELSRKLEETESAQSTFSQLEERLQLLHSLKKKYGPTLLDVIEWKEKQKRLLVELEGQAITLAVLEERQSKAKAEVDTLASKLTKERTKGAKTLSKLLTNELVQLNMPHALFEVAINACERTNLGDEQIEFMLTPNLGEPPVNVQKGISGGELARLALAFKCVMIDKNPVGTILFDEIDANIGGKTASIVGQKLAELGKTCQVIAITHFAQVARSADVHFCIQKYEAASRTTSHIQMLDSQELRQDELARMLGDKISV